MGLQVKDVKAKKRKLVGPGTIEVGVFDGQLAAIAAINEFGTDTIPSRPAFGVAVARLRVERLPSGLKPISNPVGTAEAIGEHAVELMREEVIAMRSPPNAESTLDKKSGNNPLIDTGQLLDGIEWRDAD